VLFASHHLYLVFFLLTLCFFLTNGNIVVEVEKTGAVVGFLDPECLNFTMLTSKAHTLDLSVSYMQCAFKLYATKKLILTSYLSKNNWIAVAIILKQQKVYYLDSFKSIEPDITLFKLIINE
jgi:hypothetical protein